jgi:hypothetical protein
MLFSQIFLIEVFVKLLLISNLLIFTSATNEQNKENNDTLTKIWDLTNVPVELVNFASIEEVLDILAQRKYRSCQASVLFNPLKKAYMIRDPSKKKSKIFHLKDYIPLQCKKFKSRTVSFRDRFFLTNKHIEKLLEYNQDSVLKEGINAFPDIKHGLEVSLFPVKLYTAVQESHYTFTKDHLCYDSMKILGIDENNNVFLVFIAGNQHRIFLCEGYDISKYIRYTSFCDEFCNEDFIYFSQELVKCRCNFAKFSNNETSLDSETESPVNQYTNILDKYENFANSHEITLKLYRAETKNKSYMRYYLYIITCIFTLQVLYVSYFYNGNSFFIKCSIVFYKLIVILLYIPERIKVLDKFQVEIVFELISDLYPVILLVVKVLQVKEDEKTSQDISKLSIIILLNCMDCILRESLANEIELIIRFLSILLTFLQAEDKYLGFFFTMTRTKLIFEFFSRLNFFLVDKDLLTDFSVPCHILFGRPREFFQFNDHLLFQINYVKIKQYFSNLYGNWFLEAINFHKVKNMLVFLKILRYFLVLYILTLFNRFAEIKKGFEFITTCKFDYLFSWGVNLAFFNSKQALSSANLLINIIHLPIVVSFFYSNVFLTKESIYIFIAHMVFGYFMCLLNDNKGKRTFNRSRPRMSGSNVHNFRDNEQDNLSENILLNGNN